MGLGWGGGKENRLLLRDFREHGKGFSLKALQINSVCQLMEAGGWWGEVMLEWGSRYVCVSFYIE
jgi:hypothetical protein